MRGAAPGVSSAPLARYTIQKKLVAVGRDYVIEDAQGAKVWEVDGKVRFATTFAIEDAAGAVLLRCREKLMTLDPTIIVSRGSEEVARVRRTTTGSGPHVYEVEVPGAPPMKSKGGFLFGPIRIEEEGAWVATLELVVGQVVNETFLLDIAAKRDGVLIVAVAMCLVALDGYRGELVSAT